jgi:adenosylcobinamide-phosphate synthase
VRPDLTLLAAIALDRWLGEPWEQLHPVVWMGRSIAWSSRRIPWDAPREEFRYGLGMAVGTPLLWSGAVWAAVRVAHAWNRVFGFLLGAWLLKTTFAVRSLDEAARRVHEALADGDLAAGRRAVARLVSRPVDSLDEAHVASAAVESVAESTADAFVGPWLTYALFGLPGAVAYRAVNTLDSMIGYHGRYEHVGCAPARLDDLVNLLPSRLAALCLILGARLAGADGRAAWRVMRRDHRLTESPNAGWPMAAMAGALGVILEKPGHYRLNGDAREPQPTDIVRSLTVMRGSVPWGAAVGMVIWGLRRGRG